MFFTVMLLFIDIVFQKLLVAPLLLDILSQVRVFFHYFFYLLFMVEKIPNINRFAPIRLATANGTAEYILVFAESPEALSTDDMKIGADHHRSPRVAIIGFIADGAFEY